jgi:hypothetical protein
MQGGIGDSGGHIKKIWDGDGMPSLPFPCASQPLSAAGFQAAIATLGIDAATLWAMLEVETQGFGYLADRRPRILFERHIFSRLTAGAFDASNPDISNPVPGGYGGNGAPQYGRLAEAMACDQSAALQSASWGMGQVMGENFAVAGYAAVEDMVAAMCASEDEQLAAVVGFIVAKNLAGFLQTEDWTSYALHYNGADYAKNDYDGKLSAAYARLSSGTLPDGDVRAGQACLQFLGYNPKGVDGVLGANTLLALHRFQASNRLAMTAGIDDGVVAMLLGALPAAVNLAMP